MITSFILSVNALANLINKVVTVTKLHLAASNHIAFKQAVLEEYGYESTTIHPNDKEGNVYCIVHFACIAEWAGNRSAGYGSKDTGLVHCGAAAGLGRSAEYAAGGTAISR